MVDKKILFAVVGTSGIAPSHIKALRKCREAEVEYIYSRDQNRAEDFAKRFGLTPVRTFEEILNDKEISAVDIVTEPGCHAEYALKVMRSGKHVLIEKPLDADIEAAKAVLETAREVATVTSVISQKRFDPIIKDMKEKYDGKLIGKPFLSQVEMFWRRSKEYYESGSGWRGKYGNVLLNQALHWLDIAVWFFGQPVNLCSTIKKVNENISCYDTAIVNVEFSDGILFNIVCSTAVSKSMPDEFKIYGSKGVLSYNGYRSNNYLVKLMGLIKRKIGKSLIQLQIEDFVGAVIHKRAPAVTAADAYNVLSLIKSCEKAAVKNCSK